MRIIFVCTGNTCRSPLAESYAKTIFDNHEFLSRGVMVSGTKTSEESMNIIRDKALVTPNPPTGLQPEEVEDSLLLAMTESHKSYVKTIFPYANVHLLSEYATGESKDISDPFGGNADDYSAVFEEIKSYIDKLSIETEEQR